MVLVMVLIEDVSIPLMLIEDVTVSFALIHDVIPLLPLHMKLDGRGTHCQDEYQ